MLPVKLRTQKASRGMEARSMKVKLKAQQIIKSQRRKGHQDSSSSSEVPFFHEYNKFSP